MARITLKQLHDRQIAHEVEDREEFKSIKSKLDNDITPKLSELHDFMVRSSVSAVNPDVVKIILALIGLVGLVAGAKTLGDAIK